MRRCVHFLAGFAIALIAASACGVAAAPARAHVPFLEPSRSSAAAAEPGDPFPGAVALPDAAVSRAVYGTLAAGEEFDAYKLAVSQPSLTPVEMLVPRSAGYRDFRPAFVLVGPGLRSAGTPPAFVADRLLAAYGTVEAAANGVVVVPDPGASPRATFYEPFSFTSYYRGGSTAVELQPGRVYYLVVYDPAGATGEYALGIAEAESFTPADWVRAIVAVARIKLGLYGQGAFHLVNALILAVLLAGLAALVVVLWRRRRRRRSALRARARAAGP
jgi:hypothetical protein